MSFLRYRLRTFVLSDKRKVNESKIGRVALKSTKIVTILTLCEIINYIRKSYLILITISYWIIIILVLLTFHVRRAFESHCYLDSCYSQHKKRRLEKENNDFSLFL